MLNIPNRQLPQNTGSTQARRALNTTAQSAFLRKFANWFQRPNTQQPAVSRPSSRPSRPSRTSTPTVAPPSADKVRQQGPWWMRQGLEVAGRGRTALGKSLSPEQGLTDRERVAEKIAAKAPEWEKQKTYERTGKLVIPKS